MYLWCQILSGELGQDILFLPKIHRVLSTLDMKWVQYNKIRTVFNELIETLLTLIKWHKIYSNENDKFIEDIEALTNLNSQNLQVTFHGLGGRAPIRMQVYFGRVPKR